MQAYNQQTRINILALLFFLSGVSALVYQIAWQRLLFANLGSDIESVTVIVSVFMLGLGMGALLGGRLIDWAPHRAIMLFALAEIGIGLFGLLSQSIILGVGQYFYSVSIYVTALVSFFILLFPTLLMGATLPVLVSYLARKWANVGAATGHMYSFNTLGAAIGAFLTGYWLFGVLTLTECIFVAAAINISIAVISLIIFRKKHE
jgi:predicted membrane-bound spermidine synthase